MYSSTRGKCRLLEAWSGEENEHSRPLEKQAHLARTATQLSGFSKADGVLSSHGILTLESPRPTSYSWQFWVASCVSGTTWHFHCEGNPRTRGICWHDVRCSMTLLTSVMLGRSVAFPCSGSEQGRWLWPCGRMCCGNFWIDDPGPVSCLLGIRERPTCGLFVWHPLQKCHNPRPPPFFFAALNSK